MYLDKEQNGIDVHETDSNRVQQQTPQATFRNVAITGRRLTADLRQLYFGEHVEEIRFGYQRKYRYGSSPPLNSPR